MTAQPKTAAQVALDLVAKAKARRADPRAIWGIPWPFKGLNTLTGGIHSGELTICAARPSVGKTTIMVQCTDTVAEYLRSPEGQEKYKGHRIKLVLCESSAEVFQRRWACLMAGVSQRGIQNGTAREEQWERFLDAMRVIARMPVDYLDNAQSLDEVTSFIERGPTIWWALDYIQKCPLYPGRPNDGAVGAINLLSGALTEVARQVAPGLVLAHTPREVDKREDRRPRMGDLKGGSALEGDARVVLGLYREDIYAKIPDAEVNLPRPAELLLLKQNEGDSNRTIELLFQPKKGRFEDISDLYVEDED